MTEERKRRKIKKYNTTLWILSDKPGQLGNVAL